MPQKNISQILTSLSEIADLDWDCMLIGDGPLRSQVEADITRLGLNSRVTLTGWLEPNQVLAETRKSDIYFMPSRSEGLPVAGVQAMALGLALVLSNAGGNPELISPDANGYLVSLDQPDGFAIALRTLLSDQQTLLSARQASRRLSARFNLMDVVSAYEKMFC
jgi:glycosyltransferase involved in cell wall biosynthesis